MPPHATETARGSQVLDRTEALLEGGGRADEPVVEVPGGSSKIVKCLARLDPVRLREPKKAI